MRSGKYEIQNSSIKETVNLDIDGDNPQFKISGTIHHKFKENTHWIANIDLVKDGIWAGDIWFIEGYSGDFVYREMTVVFKSTSEIELNFKSAFSSIKKSYRHVSYRFRSVEFEYDYEKGVKPITSVNTHGHPTHPLYLPAENITISNVFERAGFEVKVLSEGTEIPSSNAGINSTWSDGEMHDAMQLYWSKFDNDPKWSMWVFWARLHDRGRGLGGIMFDSIGKAHRQGTAIFNDSFINDPRTNDPNSKEWVERMKFWTACHEMGHSFNLAHSWQKSLGDSWVPLRNESNSRSFMNYPFRTPGGEDKFFREFEYKFSNSELTFMRHAPEQFVQMGNAKWFDDHGFNNHMQDRSVNFALNIFTEQDDHEFEFLEPVMITIELSNTSNQARLVEENILTDGHHLTVVVKRIGSEAKQYLSYSQSCYEPSKVILEPQGKGKKSNSLRESLFVAASKQDWLISEPGYYIIQASIHIDDEDVISNELRLRVLPPKHAFEEELIAQDYFNDDVGRVMAFDGSMVLKNGNDCLNELTNRLPDSKAAYHAQVALAMPHTRDYKYLDPVKKEIKSAPADIKKAGETLGNALTKNVSESKKTLGTIDFDYYKSQLDRIKKQIS